MTVNLTVLGLGQVGTSLGLALEPHKERITRIGHDKHQGIAKDAQKMGAFDKVVGNLFNAVEDSDVIVLALPIDEIKPTLELIKDDLKEESVIIDMSMCMTSVGQWAKEMLPEGRYFVSASPSINPAFIDSLDAGVSSANKELFKNGVLSISTPPGMPADAVRLATELASILGCTPYYADSLEFDGLISGTFVLPQLVSAALMNAVIEQPGWQEARKLAGKYFYHVSEPLLYFEEEKLLGQNALKNKDNSVRVINNLIVALQQLRDAINDEDELQVHSLLENAQKGRAIWVKQRQDSDWEKDVKPSEIPGAMESFTRFFTGGLFKKKNKKD